MRALHRVGLAAALIALVGSATSALAQPAAATRTTQAGSAETSGVASRITLTVAPIAMRSGVPVTARATVDTFTAESTGSLVVSRLERGSWVERQRLPLAIQSQTATRTVLTAKFVPLWRGRWSARLLLGSTVTSDTTTSAPAGFIVVGPRWVALTFDGGPWPAYTDAALKVLRVRGVRATFFMVGAHLKKYPAIARHVSSAGHQLGNHTWNHPNLTACSDSRVRSELSSTNGLVRTTCGSTPKVFRPPNGLTNSRVARIARSLGLRQVLWTADGADWLYSSSSYIRQRILARTKSGGVILMHDGGGNRSAMLGALPGVVDHLRAEGYYFVTMDEWQVLKDTR
jgi:peptidoglycan-N-acetylglucosamine deacetylase